MDVNSRRAACPEEGAVVSILSGVLLSIVTCGIYSMVWQYKQMEVLNAWQEEEEYSFWSYFFLSIVTCGIYALYTEYRMSQTIMRIQETYGYTPNKDLATICLVVSLFVSPIGSLALQQVEINKWYDNLEM